MTFEQFIESIMDPRKRQYLRSLAKDLLDDGNRLKTLRDPIAPSTAVRQLKRIESAPSKFIKILLDTKPDKIFDATSDSLIHLVLFQYARLKSPARPEKHLGLRGDLLQILANDPDVAELISKAAEAARLHQAKLVSSGRGGNRHKPDPALAEASTHLLEIYTVAKDKAPSVAVCESEIKGAAIDFLEQWLNEMGFNPSRFTLRRLIEAFNERRRPFPALI
jgi:hypothetical protein